MGKNKHKRSKNKKDNAEEEKDTIPSFLKSNYFIYLVLSLIMALSFYIRAVIPYDATFRNNVVGVSIDDGIYHLRLIENLISNFPHRLWYDPFTNFPFGSVESWGNLYDLIIGSLALIFGVNNLYTIAAYVPAIMGVITIIPVYFIGAELFNKKSGLFAAFIVAILPGSFLQRSTLGFTDHHVAEVLFTTFFMMFLILAFNRIKYLPTELYWKGFFKNPIGYITKTPLKYAVLAGISLGLYILTWTTGILFAGIVMVFLVIQIIVNYYKNQSNNSLLAIVTLTYGIAALMVLPFVDLRNGFAVVFYSPTHIIVLMSAILICKYLDCLSNLAHKKDLDTLHFIGMILISFIGVMVLISIFVPSMYFSTFGSLNIVFGEKKGGSLTIGEAAPTNTAIIANMFGINYMLSLISFVVLFILFINKKESKYLIMIVWYVLILLMLFAQVRWAYYFAINIAILSGILCGYILDILGAWKDIKSVNVWNISMVVCVIALVGLIPLGSSPLEISMAMTKNGMMGEGFYEWHDAMTWMRYNTPDTGLDYNGTYIRPPDGQAYPYPDTAYGVMSWWDYGHIITYWGHRIPYANPFQSGIGGGDNHTPGASTFLIAQSESEATDVLKKLDANGTVKAKYIVSNSYMAYAIQHIFADWDNTDYDYYQALRTSQGNQLYPSQKHFNTMESKLYILDGNGLKQYRLVHESTVNPYTSGGSRELAFKEVYNKLVNPNNPIPVEISGYIKIFEYVKGANIVGFTTPNTQVRIENIIVTNINRTIHYEQIITSDEAGKYIFIVPYSTTGSIPNGTQFDTRAIRKYRLSIGNRYTEFDISETSVLNGEIINIR